MRIDYERRPELLLWAAQQLDCRFDPRLCVWFSCYDKDRLLAVVVYTNYTGCNIEISIATWSPQWCTRRFLKAIFSYPFIELHVERVTITVKTTNLRMLDIAKRLGFQQEGYHPRLYRGADAISFGMLRGHCKWLDSTR